MMAFPSDHHRHWDTTKVSEQFRLLTSTQDENEYTMLINPRWTRLTNRERMNRWVSSMRTCKNSEGGWNQMCASRTEHVNPDYHRMRALMRRRSSTRSRCTRWIDASVRQQDSWKGWTSVGSQRTEMSTGKGQCWLIVSSLFVNFYCSAVKSIGSRVHAE